MDISNITSAEELSKLLIKDSKHTVMRKTDDEVRKGDDFCEGYKNYLNTCKTEREAVCESIRIAEKEGFVPYETCKKYNAGDKVYYNNRGKSVIFTVFGTEPLENGVKISAAHIDSPRLDLKPNPLYEEGEVALFKTHYYGGIKKYQWTAIPLALHGVVILKDGTTINVSIGEEENEPCFCVSDLLIHLAGDQMKRTLSEGIKGEELNIIVGTRPFKDDKGSELVKLNIMKILYEKYGFVESDFNSAELIAVPADKARDVGFDRSLIGSYGHDDRVCAYPALMAALACKSPKKTTVTVLTDKEEIGSVGNTGLHSSYLKYFIGDLGHPYGIPARTILSSSECLSADVNAAFDPTFSDVMEKRNASYINHGVCVTKYTGSRGKSGTSDASAEFCAKVRNILDNKDVVWQTGELGKVDQGGGGTVAQYIANLNVDVIDVGVPVLSMHAPWEIVAKSDVYAAYEAFLYFFEA